jgi:predicted secreted protein
MGKTSVGSTIVSARHGDVRQAVIELEDAAVTGHVWKLSVDPELADIVAHRTVAAGESFGGAGREEFVVEVKTDRPFDIQAELRRPWESEAAETRTIHVAPED